MVKQVSNLATKKTEQKMIEKDEYISSEKIVLDCVPDCQEEIAICAYFKAEKRNFTIGYEMDDWLEAEKEIKKQHFYRFCT